MKLGNKLIFALVGLLVLSAVQAWGRPHPMRSMTLGGATGLITTPTARTGWEGGDFGINIGYHYLSEGDGSHVPKAQLNFFDHWELGATYDTQVEDDEDLLLNTKLRFYPWSGSGSTSLAIGANHQNLKNGGVESTATQTYLAVTYGGRIFNWSAETSFAIGKTFTDDENSDIDFGMGFQVSFIPSLLKNYVHWVTDFGNFSYSLDAWGPNAANRGVFNTGFRLNLLKGYQRNIHLKIDMLMLDALDGNRSYGMGATFGVLF